VQTSLLFPSQVLQGKRKSDEYYGKREFLRGAVRVAKGRRGDKEIKWCENRQSWMAELYEDRKQVRRVGGVEVFVRLRNNFIRITVNFSIIQTVDRKNDNFS
jgi:hypothetical protein